MIADCGNCVGARAEICRVAFDTYESRFVAAKDQTDTDVFTQLQAFKAIGDALLGDETAVDRLTELSNPEIIEEAQLTQDDLLQALRDVGCELSEVQIAVKAMFGSIQRGYLEKASADVTAATVLPETREPLLKTLIPVERIGSQDVPSIAEVRDIAESLTARKADDLQRARDQYIADQGWDPEKLDFSQELEIKMHLKTHTR